MIEVRVEIVEGDKITSKVSGPGRGGGELERRGAGELVVPIAFLAREIALHVGTDLMADAAKAAVRQRLRRVDPQQVARERMAVEVWRGDVQLRGRAEGLASVEELADLVAEVLRADD